MIPIEVRIDGILVNAQLYGPEEPQPKPRVEPVLSDSARMMIAMLLRNRAMAKYDDAP